VKTGKQWVGWGGCGGGGGGGGGGGVGWGLVGVGGGVWWVGGGFVVGGFGVWFVGRLWGEDVRARVSIIQMCVERSVSQERPHIKET